MEAGCDDQSRREFGKHYCQPGGVTTEADITTLFNGSSSVLRSHRH